MAIDLGTGRTAKNLTVSLGHTVCALLDNNTIKCWGQNYAGQLGLGIPFDQLETLGGNPGEMGDNLPTVDVGM